MYLQERRGWRLAVHYNPRIAAHDAGYESPKHKALKERIATAAERAGFTVVIEDQASHGKRRTDVLVHGAGGLRLGCEAQLSRITAQTVRRRSEIAVGDGITPLWTTNDPKASLIDQAPWARINDMPWQAISTGRELLVRGGVRELRMYRCDETRPTVCPITRRGRCGKWHGTWEIHAIQLDDLIGQAAAKQYVPLSVPAAGKTSWMWVTTTDRDKYLDNTRSQPQRGNRTPSPGSDTLFDLGPQPLDRTCRYGTNTGIPLPPENRRDDGAPINAATLTLDHLATEAGLPIPPPRPGIRKGICGAGTTPCGQPARLFACGWRCEHHQP